MSFQPLPYLWNRQIERIIEADWPTRYEFEFTVWWTKATSTAPKTAGTRGLQALVAHVERAMIGGVPARLVATERFDAGVRAGVPPLTRMTRAPRSACFERTSSAFDAPSHTGSLSAPSACECGSSNQSVQRPLRFRARTSARAPPS